MRYTENASIDIAGIENKMRVKKRRVRNWGGSRGGLGGSVEPPKLKSQTFKTVRFLIKFTNKVSK